MQRPYRLWCVRKQNDNALILGGRVKELQRLGKGVGVVGSSAGLQSVHSSPKLADRSDELGVLLCRICEADDADAAAAADLAILGAVGGLVDNVNEFFRPVFQIGQGASGHASGAIQHHHNIHRAGHNAGLCRQGEPDLKRLSAFNGRDAQGLIGIGYSHVIAYPF